MSEIVPIPTVPAGGAGYRKEDPTHVEIGHAQSMLRLHIDNLVLDPEVSFYDKLYTLEATQRGNWQPYHHNRVAEALDEARARDDVIFLSTVSQGRGFFDRRTDYYIGKLDDERPWDFVRAPLDKDPGRIDLQVRFKAARTISDTVSWLHESYGQASMRSETSPNVEQLKELAVNVGLPGDPGGSEHLYGKVEAYSGTLRIGAMAIHQAVQEMSKKSDDRKAQAALQAAVSIAMYRIAAEL